MEIELFITHLIAYLAGLATGTVFGILAGWAWSLVREAKRLMEDTNE